MTPSERKALLFLATVGVLGAGARLAVTPGRADTPASRAALERQLGAVDSARAADRASDRSGAGARRRPRRRVGGDGEGTAPAPGRPPLAAVTPPALPVDVDVADVAALEALPGVGPALARRIVEERATGGAFGSVTGLQRVRGVGPKLAARLAPHVTFSGVPRPSSAAVRRPP